MTEQQVICKAKQLMDVFKLHAIYRTSNNLWFTNKNKAESYALANNLLVVEYESTIIINPGDCETTGGTVPIPLSNTVWINHDLLEDNEEQRIFKSYNDAILWIEANGNVNEDNQWQVMLPGGTIPEITLYEYINVSGIDGTRIETLKTSVASNQYNSFPAKSYISTVIVDNIDLGSTEGNSKGLTIYNSIINNVVGQEYISVLFAADCKFFGGDFNKIILDAFSCQFIGTFNNFHSSMFKYCTVHLSNNGMTNVSLRGFILYYSTLTCASDIDINWGEFIGSQIEGNFNISGKLTTLGLTTQGFVVFNEIENGQWINLDSPYKKTRLIQSAAEPVEEQIYSNESLAIVLLPDTDDVVINIPMIYFDAENETYVSSEENHLLVMVKNLGSTSKVTFNGPIFDIANPDLNSFDVNVTSEFELVRYQADNIRENDKWIIKSISLNTMSDLFE